jgi:hypothetical protein
MGEGRGGIMCEALTNDACSKLLECLLTNDGFSIASVYL